MVDRMIRAAKGDVNLYEEVEATPSLNQEAYTIVAIVAVINVVGVLLAGALTGEGSTIVGAIVSGLGVFLGYMAWAYLTYFIGTRVFNGTADAGELQRTIGYAMTPQILSFIPCVGFLASLWSLYLGVVAVRQALDFDTGKALMTAGLAFLAYLAIALVIGLIFGVGAAGANMLTGG